MVTFKTVSNQTVVGAFLLFLLLDDVLVVLLSLSLLVLLVLCDQVVHVGLCLRELHLVHTLACVPGFDGFGVSNFVSGVFKDVYQWRKAFLLNITAKESDTLRIRPWVVNIVLPYVCHVYNLYIKNQTH